MLSSYLFQNIIFLVLLIIGFIIYYRKNGHLFSAKYDKEKSSLENAVEIFTNGQGYLFFLLILFFLIALTLDKEGIFTWFIDWIKRIIRY